MAKPKEEKLTTEEAGGVSVGDKFVYGRSGTVVEVMRVCDESTVDVQEPGHKRRYWGAAKLSDMKPHADKE